MQTRICKQCGRAKCIEDFTPYKSRGAGIRKSTVGRNPVCTECVRFNANISRIWKIPEDSRTEAQQQALEMAKTFYIAVSKRGLHPLGAYCKHVLGQEVPESDLLTNVTAYTQGISGVDDSIEQGFRELLTLELTEEPDVYQDKLNALVDTCSDQFGKVLPQYKELFTQVATKFDDYEDNYDWDSH